MQNQRFYKTEHSIFIAYYSFKNYPTAKMLARRAQISCSTLYRHHHRTQDIPCDYEDFLLSKFNKHIEKVCRKGNFSFRRFYLYFLVYIFNNRPYFLALFRDNHKSIVISMLKNVKPFILSKWHLAENTDKMYSVYTHEILGLIENWAKCNFSKKMLEQTLGDIMYLTNSAYAQLIPLLGRKSK